MINEAGGEKLKLIRLINPRKRINEKTNKY